MENEIPVYVRNWELKTWILKPRFENPDSWLQSKKSKNQLRENFKTLVWLLKTKGKQSAIAEK